VSCKPVLYGKNDFYRTYAEFWYKKMPDHYWGVGYDNGINVPKSDTTTLYQRNWLRLYSKIVRQVYPNLFGGIVFDINQTKASNINENMLNDPDYQAMGPISRNSGLGIVFQYDSRDLAVNAYKGLFFDITYLHYDRYLGGENRFDVLELDYRQYKELGHRHILAWNYKLRYAIGDVPYTEMSQLGSPFDLRGYFWGRFRDKQSTIAIIEYRHMFNRKKPNKKGSLESPFGFATWVAS
jgi:outer membrane protein assembly factor BamA